MPLPPARCPLAGLTDTGRVRSHNEDAIAIEPDCGLALLADGMGGYRAGEVASAIAIEQARAELLDARHAGAPGDEARLLAAFERANRAIRDASASRPQWRGMGTTLVLALFGPRQAMIAHVGDSRAYRLRAGRLQRLTRDHSLVQEQIDAGRLAPAQVHQQPYRHLLTRALGVEAQARPDIARHSIAPGDRFLLCSDGLHDLLDDGEIEALLRHGGTLADCARALVDAANAAGGHDNISVVLAQPQPDTSGQARWPN